jgi:hypothetical protein
VHEAVHFTARYSAHHAWMTLALAEQAAAVLGWPQARVDSLGRAALTMKVAITRLKDHLATVRVPPTIEQRREIASHAERSAALLAAAGLDVAVAVEAVRLHHDAHVEGQPLQEQTPARQVARLLRRADLFGVSISRRGSRAAMSPLAAACGACLGPDGQPASTRRSGPPLSASTGPRSWRFSHHRLHGTCTAKKIASDRARPAAGPHLHPPPEAPAAEQRDADEALHQVVGQRHPARRLERRQPAAPGGRVRQPHDHGHVEDHQRQPGQ